MGLPVSKAVATASRISSSRTSGIVSDMAFSVRMVTVVGSSVVGARQDDDAPSASVVEQGASHQRLIDLGT
jgi:hypothetical protein